MTTYGETFAAFYEQICAGAPRAAGQRIVDFTKSRLPQHEDRPLEILDLACGTGELLRLFASEGWHGTGVDLSSPMLDQAACLAKEAGLESLISFNVADATRFLPERVYDAVTLTGDAINHFMEDADLSRLVANIAPSVRSGGFLLCDVLLRGGLQRHNFHPCR